MKKIIVTVGVLSLCAALAGAQAASKGALTLSVMPGVSYCLPFAGLPSGYYDLPFGLAIDVDYQLPFLPLLFAKAGITGRRAPLSAGPVLWLLEASAGLGARIPLGQKVQLKPYAAAGYHYGILSLPSTNETGGAWSARAGANVQLDFFAPVGIVIGAAAVLDGGAFLGVQGSAGVSYTFGAPVAAKPPVVKPEKPKPEPKKPEPTKPEKLPAETPKIEPKPTEAAGGLTLKPQFDYVFPVFQGWYYNNPLGSLTLANGGRDAISGIKVSFDIKEYTVGPWSSSPEGRLEPGKELKVPLHVQFNREKILDINSATKSLAEITVDYLVGSDKRQAKWSESVRLQGRNEMTWSDDRRAAAFVTASDPAVMTFARNVASAVKGSGSTAINANLAKAMAIHEAMRVFQMTYMVDPKTPYKDLVQKKDALDRLQFPRETLQYKAGDCDDLSILYCSLLESLAVHTAFITIPGHIFMAFSVEQPPAAARQQFKRADELIFDDPNKKTWIPIEVTSLGDKDDFLEAWLLGAKEWRENSARGQARLYPLEEAWQLYEPVSLPKDNAPPPVAPASAALVDRYQRVTIRFLDREMADQLASLNRKVTESKEDPKVINSLGVLYAKYGRYDEAKVQFKKASAKSKSYLSPLLNLGMIAIAEKDLSGALGYYEEARKIEPKNSQALLGFARVNHELENYGSVRTAYEELKKLDPNLATQFAYLDLRGDEAARAAEISKAKEVTLWADQ